MLGVLFSFLSLERLLVARDHFVESQGIVLELIPAGVCNRRLLLAEKQI